MISAIVFTPDMRPGDDLVHLHETVARSLFWLVSAVVCGVVRDVTLAVPGVLGLSELADQCGCTLVERDAEGDRLTAAVSTSKEPRVIVLKAGYHPDPGLVDEIDSFARREPTDAMAALLAAPASVVQRFFPHLAPVVGIMMPRTLAGDGSDFARLAGLVRRNGVILRTNARPIA